MIFLRHPQPDIEANICYGRTDMDIAEIGHLQIEKAVHDTPAITRLVASPARRCRKLALALAARNGIEPVFDERLWEMHMGEFEGLSWDAIDRSKSDEWLSDPLNNKTPGGEAFIDLQKRVLEAVSNYLDDDRMQTAFVCHAGPIRSVQMAWLGLSFKQAFAETPPYATPIRILPTAE